MPDSLENVALLPLLLLVFLPLILHLLDRRRARVVLWPAVRFLLAADKRVLRRLKLLETLLIVSRSLVLFCVILAVLRPFRSESVLRREVAEKRRGAVIVIDTSFSMAYRSSPQGPSSLERARELALRLLEDFRPGDRVDIIEGTHFTPPSSDLDRAAETPASATERRARGGLNAPGAAGDPAPRDLESARARVRAADFRAGTFRLIDALEHAADRLEELLTETRELFILTDLTASSFPSEDRARLPLLRARLMDLPPPAPLRLLDCGARAARNRAVVFVRTGALALGTDREVELDAGVRRWSAEGDAETAAERSSEAGATVLRLLAGGEELAARDVTLEAGQTARVRFVRAFNRGGDHLLTAEISADGLREDDRRYHVLEVCDRIAVLVAGTSSRDEGSARYVWLALAPEAGGAQDIPVIFANDFTAELEIEDLSPYRVLILCDLPRQSAGTLLKIEAFVRAGGGLLIFSGEETHAASWNEHTFRGRHGLLPVRLSEAASRARFAPMHPTEVLTTHSALAVFAAPDEGDLERIEVHRLTGSLDLSPDAVVLAKVDTGESSRPWIVEKACGRGKVILVTTSALPADTSLPRSTLFLPLVHQLSRYLAASDPGERNLSSGEPIRYPYDASRAADSLFVTDPSGREHALLTVLERGQPAALFEATHQPGFYAVHARDPAGSRSPPRAYAVNFPAPESDLERLGEGAVAELRNHLDLEVFHRLEDVTGTPVEVIVRRQFWPYMVALAIAFLFVESLIARRLAPGRSMQPARP